MMTKYVLMSGDGANSRHAESISRELGIDVLFWEKPFSFDDVIERLGSSTRVAIVDKAYRFALSLSRCLNDSGITTDAYPSGNAFLKTASGDYDFVLCDTVMPGTMGTDVIREHVKGE